MALTISGKTDIIMEEISIGGFYMTYHDMECNSIDVQTEVHFYYYDYELDERIEIDLSTARYREIRFIYCENNELCIEVEAEEE